MGDNKILVIGSINMDLIYSLPRVPGPGENLFAREYKESPGGKGSNQAIAVSRLGGNVSYIGKIGDDEHGESLRKSLENFNVNTDHLLVANGVSTGRALILLEDNGQNRIIVLRGANGHLTTDDIKEHLDKTSFDVILLQLEIPLETVEFIINYAGDLDIPVIVDAGPAEGVDVEILKGVEIISPNQAEIYSLTGHKAENLEQARSACQRLQKMAGSETIILKMGELGALVYNGEDYNHYRAYPVEVRDTTAAGDAFSAALAVGYAAGWPLDKIIPFANATGALAVSKLGAHSSMPELADVKQFLVDKGVEIF